MKVPVRRYRCWRCGRKAGLRFTAAALDKSTMVYKAQWECQERCWGGVVRRSVPFLPPRD